MGDDLAGDRLPRTEGDRTFRVCSPLHFFSAVVTNVMPLAASSRTESMWLAKSLIWSLVARQCWLAFYKTASDLQTLRYLGWLEIAPLSARNCCIGLPCLCSLPWVSEI